MRLCHLLSSPLACFLAKADDKFQPGDIVAGNLIAVRLADRQRERSGEVEGGWSIALPKNPSSSMAKLVNSNVG